MAKGVEDTAFYRYFRLTALNEVGGDPGRFSLGLDDFHAANSSARGHSRCTSSRRRRTTRSARRDVRARIGALAWLADEWAGARARVARRTRRHRRPRARSTSSARRSSAPGRSTGTARRLSREGAARRQGNTNWLAPNEEHERDVQEFAARAPPTLLAPASRSSSTSALGRQDRARAAAAEADLAGPARHLPAATGSGLSLVDPDNRRPVDWDARRAALAALRRRRRSGRTRRRSSSSSGRR